MSREWEQQVDDRQQPLFVTREEPSEPSEPVSKMYEPGFESIGLDGLDATKEPEEAPEEKPEREQPEREEIPEYDVKASMQALKNHADEASNLHVRARLEQINRELSNLPKDIPSEDDLLRMSETDRIELQRGMARREQLQLLKTQVIPSEYRQVQEMNRAKAQAIVGQQQQVFSKYPQHAQQVLDAVRNMVDTGKIGAPELATETLYDMVYTMVRGNEVREKENRKQLRKVAQGAQVAGRGNAPVNEEAFGGGESEMFGKSARQAFNQYLKMGFDEERATAATRRLFKS